ncbi:hypothetical protein D7V93_34180 [Corallococcus llansteffanensis]|uniref:Uncharacterized protein n=2 Tax=Corallococcus llansteffanensis TaxID=2316731 RepID=A0A3A8NS02_9BACT|nr:hypothetical protein D7V93_34180 [Corallococcus llansteffanensis]
MRELVTYFPPPPPPPPPAPKDAFVPPPPRRQGPELTGVKTAEPAASTLLTEDSHDGSANCLDQVGDWLELASPEIRARSEVVLLRDNRPGAEGEAGHAVIRQGEGVFDPSTGQSYPSLEAFLSDGRYSVEGKVSGTAMNRILSTPPGSPERQEALDRAGVSPTLAVLQVADSGPTVDVAEAWTALTQGYAQSRSLTGAANAALQQAAGKPALQAKLIDLLQATPASTLENALSRDFAHGVQEAVPNPPPRPKGVTSVGTTRVANSALEAVAKQGNATTLKPALDSAVSRGHLLATDRDVLVSCLGSTGAATDAKLDTAVAQVHAAEQAYTGALAQREALEQQLASDIASFGPYLTDTQQRGYIQEFRSLHAADYAGFEAKAKALDTALTRNAPLLEQALRGPDGSAHAQSIHAAYGALAQSSHAAAALTWAAKMERPGSAFAPFMTALPLNTVRENAVSGALVSFFEKNPQATQSQAVDHIQSLLTDGYLLQQAGGATADLKVSNLPKAWQTGLAGLRQIAGGSTQAGMNTLKSLSSGNTAWAGPFAAAGLVLGLMQANHSAQANDALGTAWATAFSGQQGMSLLGTALSAAKLSGGAQVAARVAGGFGAVAAALDIFVKANTVASGQGNAGTGLAIAGDVMGLAGGALIALGSTGVGVPLAAVGAAVYIIGELVSMGIMGRQEAERQDQLRSDQRTILGRVSVDAEQITNLAKYTSPEQIDSIVQDTGWTRDQVLSLGKTFPDFFASTARLAQLDQVANDFGLTPDQRFQMLNAIGESGSPNEPGNIYALQKFAEAVRNFPNNTVGINIPPNLSRQDQWVYFLRELGNRTGSYDGLGPRNAASFLDRVSN